MGYTAFNYVRKEKPEKYANVHIIRERGRATIVLLIKILNHFGTSYSVLHDSDNPRTKDGTRTNNVRILESLRLRRED